MQTTTTTITAAPELVLAPEFDAQQPTEGYAEFSRRACLWLMRQGEFSTWRLDDAALEAAANGARLGSTGRGLAADVASTLADLERRWLSLLRARRAVEAAAQALAAETVDAPIAAPAAPEAPKGGGGSKVPRRPRPTPQGPSAALRQPGGLQLQAAGPVLRPVAPLAADADLF